MVVVVEGAGAGGSGCMYGPVGIHTAYLPASCAGTHNRACMPDTGVRKTYLSGLVITYCAMNTQGFVWKFLFTLYKCSFLPSLVRKVVPSLLIRPRKVITSLLIRPRKVITSLLIRLHKVLPSLLTRPPKVVPSLLMKGCKIITCLLPSVHKIQAYLLGLAR